MLLLGDLKEEYGPLDGLGFPHFRRNHISFVELVTVKRINTSNASHLLNVQYWTPKLNYYSFNLFLRFWLAKITRITHHNQLLLTKFAKFGRILPQWTHNVKNAAKIKVNEPLTEKTWRRGWVVLWVRTKWRNNRLNILLVSRRTIV